MAMRYPNAQVDLVIRFCCIELNTSSAVNRMSAWVDSWTGANGNLSAIC